MPGTGLPLLIDVAGTAGPLAGLKAALEAARGAGRAFALTVPCDVPFLPADFAPRLRAGIGTRLVAVPATGPDLHPACALWQVAALDRLGPYLATGRRSLVGFAEAAGFVAVAFPPDGFFNVNDEAGRAEAERRLASEVQHLDHVPGFDPGASGH